MTSPRLAALRSFPWYPTLIVMVWASAIYVNDPVPFETAPRIVLIVSAIGLIVTTLWVALIGPDRGGAAAAITLTGLVAAGDPARVLLFGAGVALLLVERAWSMSGGMRLRIPWPGVTRALNILLVVFLAIQVGRSVVAANTYPLPPHAEAWRVGPNAALPDIYVIVADGHGRRDVLRESYGYDSEAFAAGMRNAGFDEAEGSWSNHTETKYALSVLLNGRPLSELGQDMSAVSHSDLAFGAVLGNSTFQMLEEAGYETTVIWSGYDHLSLRNADWFLETGGLNEAERAAWTSTAVGRVLDRVTGSSVAAAMERIVGQFEALDTVLESSPGRPQLVFMHIPSPHPPFILEGDCSLRPEDDLTIGSPGRGFGVGTDDAVRLVVDQTRCIDARLVQAAHAVTSARPGAVVLVLSDHGPEEHLDWLDPDPVGIRERVANMFWARTPGAPGLFPDDVSLVNVIPILANAYLDTELPTHPDDAFLNSSERYGVRGTFTPVDLDAP